MTQEDNKILVQIDLDLEDIIPGYLENRRKDIIGLRKSVLENDYQNLRILGHRMKGSGAGYGFDQITEIGYKIEMAARSEDGQTILDATMELERYLDNVEITYTAE
jgi:HPt (histidine-containing phosphotransfer) domain-containing protein